MAELYPPIEPYQAGLLGAGDGTAVYWEACGNPDGKPALFVHGGPGSGCGPNQRRGSSMRSAGFQPASRSVPNYEVANDRERPGSQPR
jgi:pimeloyl-ACP methyl ester carboxylesterase